MEYSEKWGKDVDEAVRLALEDLSVTEDDVMVTVLEEPVKGFLGLGQKLAKVRVEKLQPEEGSAFTQQQTDESKKTTYKDLRKKNKPQGAQGGSGGGGNRSGGRDGGGRNRDDSRRRDDNRFGGERHDRDADRAPRRRREESYEDFAGFDFDGKPSLSERPADLAEIEDTAATRFLQDIVTNMKLKVCIKTYGNDDCIYIEVEGEDAKTVIGKRGQTLDSIQYLTNLVANKDREDYLRVIIDVEGYRSRREKTLEKLAVKLAQKVQQSGRSVKLEPMNPYERKVIHATLQSISGITTKSEGEEPYRRVVIEKVR